MKKWNTFNGSLDPKIKAIIISSAAVVVLIIIIFASTAIVWSDDERIATLKYNFNSFYSSTFDHTNLEGTSTELNDIAMKVNSSTADTDGDGITDDIERVIGLNPNSDMSDGSILDSERSFTRNMSFEDGNIIIEGNANIYNATVEKLSLNAVRSNSGTLTHPYELHCEGSFDNAKIRFNYNEKDIKIVKTDIKNLHIYKFDPYRREYVNIGGNVNKNEHTVECDVTENGVYLLGADTIIDKSAEAYSSEKYNIHLIIDNSGSLYASTPSYQSEENDVNFRRLIFAKRFVNEFSDDVKFAISVFTYDFKTLSSFNNDKSQTINAIESIRTLGAGFDGTSVERAMVKGLDSFTEDMADERNIIVILTDGISTTTAGYTEESVLSRAKEKNVMIMTISLGRNYDKKLLENIAKKTGGRYYSIMESDLLENLHLTMMTSMDSDIVDDDDDGEPDSYMLYDTGFDIATNGFSFDLLRDDTGEVMDYGMMSFARDWFRNSFSEAAREILGDNVDILEPLHKCSLQCLSPLWFKPDTYLEFRSIGDTLRVSSEERNNALKSGWQIINIPYEEELTKWTKYELLAPKVDSDLLRMTYGQHDSAVLKAIGYYDSQKDNDNCFTINNEASINEVKDVLGSGEPMILKLTWNEDVCSKSRYVLLTNLRRDLDDPNLFKMKVYDIRSSSISNILLSRVRVYNNYTYDYIYVGKWNDKTVTLTGYIK